MLQSRKESTFPRIVLTSIPLALWHLCMQVNRRYVRDLPSADLRYSPPFQHKLPHARRQGAAPDHVPLLPLLLPFHHVLLQIGSRYNNNKYCSSLHPASSHHAYPYPRDGVLRVALLLLAWLVNLAPLLNPLLLHSGTLI